jgi:hypothetical protein
MTKTITQIEDYDLVILGSGAGGKRVFLSPTEATLRTPSKQNYCSNAKETLRTAAHGGTDLPVELRSGSQKPRPQERAGLGADGVSSRDLVLDEFRSRPPTDHIGV